MSDTQVLFQELSSTYSVFFTMFFQITGLYVTLFGVAINKGLHFFRKPVEKKRRTDLLLFVAFFVLLISVAYFWALWHASTETKVLEDNLQKTQNLLSLNSAPKGTPKAQTPCLLSKVIYIMRVISGIIILAAIAIGFFVRRTPSDADTGGSSGNISSIEPE